MTIEEKTCARCTYFESDSYHVDSPNFCPCAACGLDKNFYCCWGPRGCQKRREQEKVEK